MLAARRVSSSLTATCVQWLKKTVVPLIHDLLHRGGFALHRRNGSCGLEEIEANETTSGDREYGGRRRFHGHESFSGAPTTARFSHQHATCSHHGFAPGCFPTPQRHRQRDTRINSHRPRPCPQISSQSQKASGSHRRRVRRRRTGAAKKLSKPSPRRSASCREHRVRNPQES